MDRSTDLKAIYHMKYFLLHDRIFLIFRFIR